ncbi:related to Sorbose reductase homolog SOU2 [Zygosaccharomyces bailii]|nr:related to Sorbose reductase homolog SOU2 [Zygosaccharomyces bailii]
MSGNQGKGNTKVGQEEPTLPDNVMDYFSLKGKVAIVTGASGGIGYQVSLALAQAGADVAMWYNSNPKIEQQVGDLSKKYGVKIRAYQCTLTDSAAVERVVDAVVKDYGKIDVVVANAGVNQNGGAIVDYSEKVGREKCDKEWQHVVDVDFNSVYYLADAAGKHFKKQKKGSFIITASMSGHIVNIPRMHAAYNAAKAGVIHLGKSLAVEWAGFARVNSVSPGYIGTPMTARLPAEVREQWESLVPLGRLANPKELVGAYLYLASDASTYTTGTDILVDGGYTCI